MQDKSEFNEKTAQKTNIYNQSFHVRKITTRHYLGKGTQSKKNKVHAVNIFKFM